MKRLLIALGLILAISILPVGSKAQLAGLGLTISPVTDEFSLEAGRSIEREFRIINPTAQTATFYPVILNFTTDNTEGKPIFYSSNEKHSRYSMSEWVSFERPLVRLAPGEVDTFNITVSAPKDAEPGGHYSALFFSTEEPKFSGDSSQVGVVGLIGSLMLANVPGEITQKLEIEEFSVPSIAFKSPINTSLLFNNPGNTHQKPVGEIKVRNWSKRYVTAIPINAGGGNVLPESRRAFNATWSYDSSKLGLYSLTAVVTYGSPLQTIQLERKVLIIPAWFIVLVVLLLLFVLRRRLLKVFKPKVRATKLDARKPIIR